MKLLGGSGTGQRSHRFVCLLLLTLSGAELAPCLVFLSQGRKNVMFSIVSHLFFFMSVVLGKFAEVINILLVIKLQLCLRDYLIFFSLLYMIKL